ncbi:MAG: hypothetical protein Q8O87_02915 [bacterium]|nr:hypothetical protein [bacterium]
MDILTASVLALCFISFVIQDRRHKKEIQKYRQEIRERRNQLGL